MSQEYDGTGYRTPGLSSPAERAIAVNPSNSINLPVVSRAIYVGTGGNITVLMQGGDTVTIQNVADGTILPIRVSRVNATDTTASNIVSFW